MIRRNGDVAELIWINFKTPLSASEGKEYHRGVQLQDDSMNGRSRLLMVHAGSRATRSGTA